MLTGRWSQENRATLQELLGARFSHTAIAIFDWDNTCIDGDIADLTFHHLCADMKFRFSHGGFWAWIDEIAFPNRIADYVESYLRAATSETRHRLRFELERVRHLLHEGEDDNRAWAWDGGAFVGWTPEEVREYAQKVIRQESASPFEIETLIVDGHDPLQLAHGLGQYPEMQVLMQAFIRAGWDVRIISASPQWLVEECAAQFGIEPDRVIGMRREIVNERITASVDSPCSWGDGKLDAYQMFVTRQRPPNFVAGDSLGDWKLLEWATDCALLIEPIRDALRNYAQWRRELGDKWLVQKFS